MKVKTEVHLDQHSVLYCSQPDVHIYKDMFSLSSKNFRATNSPYLELTVNLYIR